MEKIGKRYIKEIYLDVLKRHRKIKIVNDEIVVSIDEKYNRYEWTLKNGKRWGCTNIIPIYEKK